MNYRLGSLDWASPDDQRIGVSKVKEKGGCLQLLNVKCKEEGKRCGRAWVQVQEQINGKEELIGRL